ncbi:MFS transporter [Nakamurella silvestris]|nr:MFS transporter [Nakamurella silvestris]
MWPQIHSGEFLGFICSGTPPRKNDLFALGFVRFVGLRHPLAQWWKQREVCEDRDHSGVSSQSGGFLTHRAQATGSGAANSRGRTALPSSFRTLLASWGASLTGDGLRVVALPLLAAWIDPSPVSIGAVAVATTLPWLLIAAPAGALVDRLNPARVILVSHLLRALITACLVGVVLMNSATILILCAIGFALTAAETFADGAAQSLLVDVVPTVQLERANARFVTVETLALDMAGPLAAGFLFMLAPWLPFAVSAVGFLIAATLVRVLVQRPPPSAVLGPGPGPAAAKATISPTAGAAEAAQESVESERAPATGGGGLAEGLRFLFASPVLRTLVLTVAVMVIANAATDAMLVLYATESLGLSQGLYPTLLASYSVGTLIAAVLAGRLSDRFRGGPMLLVAMVVIGLTMLVMGLAVHPVVAWASYALMGVAGGTWNVLSATRRQRHTPRSMIARVSSAFRVVAWGIIPVGAGLGGFAGQHFGVPAVFAGGGVLVLALAAVVGRYFLRPEPGTA